MQVDEEKETALISSFIRAKEENVRRPIEVGIVVRLRMPEVALWPREQFLSRHCSMEPGREQRQALYSTARPIPDPIVRRGKKL